MQRPKKPISKREQVFIREYLVDLSGAKAAQRAGYKAARLDQAAYELLRKPEIKREIRRLLADRAKRLSVSADNVLKELAFIAFFDPLALFDENGVLKRIDELPEHARQVIASIEVRTEEGPGKSPSLVTKIKFNDKIRSLEMLMKHLGLLIDRSKIELTGKDGKPLVSADEATVERVFERLKRRIEKTGQTHHTNSPDQAGRPETREPETVEPQPVIEQRPVPELPPNEKIVQTGARRGHNNQVVRRGEKIASKIWDY